MGAILSYVKNTPKVADQRPPVFSQSVSLSVRSPQHIQYPTARNAVGKNNNFPVNLGVRHVAKK